LLKDLKFGASIRHATPTSVRANMLTTGLRIGWVSSSGP
jgi:hypothetical protein